MLLCLVAASLLLLGALCAFAQENASQKEPAKTPPQIKQVLPSYEGQKVSTVEIAGRPDIDIAALKSSLEIQPGDKFSREKVNASIAALKAAGHFQDVQLQIVPDIEGVRVLLVIQPGMYFGMYEFPGALPRFPYSRLLQVSNYPPEGPYSPVDIERAQQALERFLQRSGYFQAQVKPTIQTDAKHGLVNVSFNTTLGKKAKFGNVVIEGATPQETKQLEEKTHSIMARLKGAAIRKGKPFSPVALRNATTYLEGQLSKQDFLGATVKLVGAEYDPAANKADVHFHVTSGPKMHVKVEGAHVWSWTRKKLLPVYQQIGADPELIQEGRQNLVSKFQADGYFDAQVKVTTSPSADGGESIVYQITKGPRHKVKGVEIAGNQALSDDELMPHVAVQKGHFLSHGKYSQKLVKQSVKNLEGMYHAAGFSTATVTPQVKNESDGDIKVAFRVDEGPRDVVESLEIVGNNQEPVAQLAPKGLNVEEGKPYSQKLVDEDRDQITARYLNLGYLTATFRATAKPIGKDPHRLAVRYEIYEGPRVTTSDVITLGRSVTRQSFINMNNAVRQGHPLTEEEMLVSESKLYEPGIFDWAEIDPRRQITTQDEEDVVVKVHEAQRNALTYGFGFEVINRGGSVPSGTVAVPGLPPVGLNKNFKTSEKTFWGPRASFEYTRKNIRGKAETGTFAFLAGRLLQRGAITFQDPHFRSSDWASTVSIGGENNLENPIFSLRRAEAGFDLQKPLNSARTATVSLRYDFRETGLTHLLIPELVPKEDQHVRLSTLSATYTRDTRDNALDAHKGIYESFETDFNPSSLGSSANFSKLLGQTAYYRDVHKGIIWANSVRLGILEPFSGHVPLSEEFFSGGGSTLRGFPLNGAGPQRTISACGTTGCFPITVPVGGNQLFIVNSEFRIPLPIMNHLGMAAFYDGGNVFRDVGFHGQYTNTFGVGLRYATPVGPVRIDLGHNLNAPLGVKATQIFITLGQAF